MANNVEVDPGAAPSVPIASDEISGVHYQLMKLAGGMEADETRIASGGGTETNALRVTIANNSTGLLSVDGAVSPAEGTMVRVSKRVALSSSQTGIAVWTPGSGKKFVLLKLICSCKTAGDVQFFDGTDSGNTVIGPIYTLAVGGVATVEWTREFPYRSAALNNILKYTSGAGFLGSVSVEGWEES